MIVKGTVANVKLCNIDDENVTQVLTMVGIDNYGLKTK